MQIYLARNQQQAGPYTLDELNQMLKGGQVVLSDLIWHQGMTEWKTVGEMTNQQYEYRPHQAHTPTPPQQTVSFAESIAQQSANPSTVNLHKNPATAQNAELASISQRLFAKMIDLALWIPSFFFLTAFMNQQQYMQILELQSKIHSMDNQQAQEALFAIIPSVGWTSMILYIIIMLALQALMLGKTGQSIGKKVMQIQIVDEQSKQPVSLFRSFTLRSIPMVVLNLLIFPIPSIIDYCFAIGKKRQTLHDKMVKTIVVNKK